MTFLQWRYTTKSTLIKQLDHDIDCAYIHFQYVPVVESALEAAYRAGLKQGRKDAIQLSKN